VVARRPADDATAPVFLRAAGHPLRWRLLGELAASDRQVQELTTRLGQPQNLVSYHLGQLRKAHLVTGRRSSADGRDTYYRLDLARCLALLADAGGALHPALRLTPPADPARPAGHEPARVLFVCTGNSSRSQMAEAFLRHRSASAVHAYSAGTHPKPVHPDAVTVMAEYGIDLAAARSKHLDTFAGDRFDHVITLCDRAREVCPEFPGHPGTAHWSMPDPAQDPQGYPAFQRAAAEIAERTGFLLHTIATAHVLEES
jgi:ArsR family transcriptional regulator, arsenate/arsenite/antimonite-responsive transcriptional repressor / arsenate reductase (thioredoxin)